MLLIFCFLFWVRGICLLYKLRFVSFVRFLMFEQKLLRFDHNLVNLHNIDVVCATCIPGDYDLKRFNVMKGIVALDTYSMLGVLETGGWYVVDY